MYAKETLDAIAALKESAAPGPDVFPAHPHAAGSDTSYDPAAHPYPKAVAHTESGNPIVVNNKAEEEAFYARQAQQTPAEPEEITGE